MAVLFSSRTFFLWFGALWVGAGLTLLYTGVQEVTRERAYEKEGQVVEAVVVDKVIKRASREGNTSTRYEIVYRFTTADGRTVEGSDAVTVEEWETLGPGSPFKVAYLPGTAEESRAQGSGGMASPFVMIGIGSLLAAVGGVLFVRTATRLRGQGRLLREGMAAQGTVLAIEPSKVAVNRVRQWNVRYWYEDQFGRPQEGTSGPLPPEEASAVEVGDAVEVRFDRARPEQSVWVRSPSPAIGPEGVEAPPGERRSSSWTRLRNLVAILGLVFVALILGESVPTLKALDRLAARHEFWLRATMMSLGVVGFVLFMGGILYRIFGGEGEPMTHDEVEDVSQGVRMEAPPGARVSTYRFRGRTGSASIHEHFSLKEAKQAWRQRAWRTSPRWRANFVVTGGALLFAFGLFGFFVVSGPAGIKLLFAGTVVYLAVRTMVAFGRA